MRGCALCPLCFFVPHAKGKTAVYAKDTEVLFPPRVTVSLRDLRGPRWQQLVAYICTLPEDHPHALAFGLLMIRLCGCVSCHPHNHRALHGCTACAQQVIARYRGTDAELCAQWERAQADVRRWLALGVPPKE